ncbi:MAG: hypothetical protein HY646_03135, partial [Acidobacteria bacterium]|nr:hypothetical protein [Acidobacteriota bacterium]
APAPAAALAPAAAAVDSDGTLYIADTGNHRIRKVHPRTGIITTVAGTGEPRFLGDDGPSTAAALSAPSGVAVDIAGNLYIADTGNSRIRKVNANGIITTIAGNGDPGFSGEDVAATSAALNFPWGVAVDPAGNVFVADSENDRIRKIAAGTGIITTVAGSGVRGFGGDNGPATAATLNFPEALAIDAAGRLLIVDTGNHRIRKVTGATITTIAGTSTAGASGDGGAATAALLNEPGGIALDQSGNIYIADTSNHRIRQIAAATGIITPVAGSGQFDSFAGDNGSATAAKLYFPQNVAVDGSGNVVVVDTGNLRIRLVSAQTGIIKTKAGSGQRAFPGNNNAATAAALGFPEGMTIDGGGNIYIADGNQVRKVSAATGTITVVAGTGDPGFSIIAGAATAAMLSSPTGLAIDGNGNLYISDSGNHIIRKVDTATGAISLVAGAGEAGFSGDNGSALAARLNTPLGLVLDSNGNLFVSDAANNRIRTITNPDTNPVITTVVGGTSSVLSFPTGLALHPSGDLLVADTLNSRIRSVVTATGAITTAAGSGTAGFSGDNGAATSAALFFPFGVAADSAGNIYIADTFNARVRRVGTNGVIRTVAGTGQVLSAGDDGAAAAASIFLPVGLRFDPSGNLYIIDAGIISRIRAVKGPIP